VNYSDARALSSCKNLAKRWLGEHLDVPVVFRTDISDIDFIRGLLVGQLDRNCTSKRFGSVPSP